MRHQKQGHNECAPTSLAILLDMPKDDIIGMLLPPGVSNWDSVVHNNALFWEAVETLVSAAWGTEAAEELTEGYYKTHRPQRCPDGKGLIMIRKPGRRLGHQVAYGNGLVYDSCADGPLSWEAWRARLPGWHVVNIVKLGEADV